VVKVQDGCDQFCAYCAIPYARVGKTSRPIADVLDELRSLAEFGYKEIVLAGIRLGSYEDEAARLPELVAHSAEIDGIERIRLSSIEPWEVSDELLDAMSNPKVCRHLHIPLQSGDDDTLRRMNRPYDSGSFRRTIERVRDNIDGVGITTDVIVGFPGETDSELKNTCALIESIDFSRLHVFRYSPRPRTSAAAMTGQVDAQTKKLRAETLIELGQNAMARFASSQIGKTLEVLVERACPVSGLKSRNTVGIVEAQAVSGKVYPETTARKSGTKQWVGFADNYVGVTCTGDASLKGKIVRVRIVGIDETGGAMGFIETG
jgi:threonylcarbamoyladenosine tRNA methylthiotransferase MtaB